MGQLPPGRSNPAAPRLFADRRSGLDQRTLPRRLTVLSVSEELRRVVDRRRGTERRSTLDRRGRGSRPQSVETPGEHLRNALQLLNQLTLAGELSEESAEDLAAAVERLRRALGALERRTGPTLFE